MTALPLNENSRSRALRAGVSTVGEALATGRITLQAAGVRTPGLDARLLLAHCLGLARETLFGHPEQALSAADSRDFEALIARRSAREPVSRIVGRREFWSLPFALTPAVLDPRPDSECVVEAARVEARDPEAALRIVDLGTGTGCLLLALLAELPNATGIGLDISAEAVAVARTNARALGLDVRARFVVGDWGAPLAGPFDLIIANPPYVPEPMLPALDGELAYDPRLALAGGADGLAAYRGLAPHVARLLAVGGRAVLEVGEGQLVAVRGLLEAAGPALRGIGHDLAGRERCIIVGASENL